MECPTDSFLKHNKRSFEKNLYRNEAAGTVGRPDGDRRRAKVLLVRVGRDQVGQDDDEGQDELDAEALPGGEGRGVGHGRLQIALIAGDGHAAKRRKKKKSIKFEKMVRFFRDVADNHSGNAASEKSSNWKG